MLKDTFKKPIYLSAISIACLSLAWPPLPLFPLLFLGFIPLLFLVENALINKKNNWHIFFWTYATFLCWNIATTWWVWNASKGGAVAMLLANSLLMALCFVAIYIIRKNLPKLGLTTYIICWIAFEFFHFRWDVAYPWLTIGNGLSMFPMLIQWMEYTGILGGTLWVLTVNIVLYKLLIETTKKRIIFSLVTVFLPLLFSIIIYVTTSDLSDQKSIEVVVAQPNLDPYNEKFRLSPVQIGQDAYKLTEPLINENTRFVVYPETAIPESFELADWRRESKLFPFINQTTTFPKLAILLGLETYEVYETPLKKCKKPTPTARSFSNSQCTFYDLYNTAGFLFNEEQNKTQIQYYHKAKLVPGVEKMPYPQYLGFLEKLAINLDGTSGSLGSSKEPLVFYGYDSIATASLICYESIFGDYVRKFVTKGASFLTIITNDGWWKNTPGYKQHLYYGSIRAIETRRQIARSANTGISCFIDHKGKISQQTSWWKPQAIKAQVKTNNYLTFYVKNGDLIGTITAFLAPFLLLGAWVKQKTS